MYTHIMYTHSLMYMYMYRYLQRKCVFNYTAVVYSMMDILNSTSLTILTVPYLVHLFVTNSEHTDNNCSCQ